MCSLCICTSFSQEKPVTEEEKRERGRREGKRGKRERERRERTGKEDRRDMITLDGLLM